jgi:crotonobetainyl-CoA:carnitine CoA-transferase CaiB-like acyl-CoA transferase
MSLGALEEKFWKNFCEAIGREDLIEKQYIEGEERLRIIEEIRNVFKSRTQKEWVDFFKDADVCCEPILTLNEVFEHPHIIHREIVKEFEFPEIGKIRQIGSPIKSSAFSFENPTPPPSWGEHTIDVLKEIGYSDSDIKRFKQVKAI